MTTETIDTAQPEALRFATHLEGFFISEEVTAHMARKIAAELRRLYAESAKSQAQHDRDSRELRSLSKARDTARRERDAAKAALAAAEARNATLTDDAARLDFMCNAPIRMIERSGDMWRVYEDMAPAEAITHKWRSIVSRYRPTAREAIDAAIQARAAASISTKGDGHG